MSAAAEDEAALRTAQDHSPHVSRTSLDEQKGSTEQSKEERSRDTSSLGPPKPSPADASSPGKSTEEAAAAASQHPFIGLFLQKTPHLVAVQPILHVSALPAETPPRHQTAAKTAELPPCGGLSAPAAKTDELSRDVAAIRFASISTTDCPIVERVRYDPKCPIDSYRGKKFEQQSPKTTTKTLPATTTSHTSYQSSFEDRVVVQQPRESQASPVNLITELGVCGKDIEFHQWLLSTQRSKKFTAKDAFEGLYKFFGALFYVLCPPIPERIVRKLAFHPPLRGFNYQLKLRHNNQVAKSIHEVIGKDFYLDLTRHSRCTPSEYDEVLKSTKPFTVKTARGNHLIGVLSSAGHRAWLRARYAIEVVLILSQPNSTDLGGFLQPFFANMLFFSDAFGVDIYGFDYSGFGYSSGRPSEANVYADIRAVYEHVRSERPNAKIVLLGYSLGTSVAIDLAASQPEALIGMILVAPFTSVLRVVRKKPELEKSCCFDRFRSVDKIGNVDVPVLICHGTSDDVIIHEHSKVLHKKLKMPVEPIYAQGADHQSILNGDYPEVFNRISIFLITLSQKHSQSSTEKTPKKASAATTPSTETSS